MSLNQGNIRTISLIQVVLILVSVSCSVTRPVEVDPNNMAYLYNPVNNPFNPKFRIFNETENRSLLSVRFFTEELFFSEANPSGEPLASLTVTVRLYNDTQGGTLSDTAIVRSDFNKRTAGTHVILNIPVTAFDGFEYTAEVRVMDNVTNRMTQSFVRFDRLSEYSPTNFKVTDASWGSEIFTPILTSEEAVNLIHRQSDADTLYIHYYKYFDYIPYPPSMVIPERTVNREAERIIPIVWSDTVPIRFIRKGIYLCAVDSNSTNGFTFFNFGEEYPNMTAPEAMLEPLAYIATQEELLSMRSNEKPKMALDEFWIARSSNIEKSRELLRIYYNRVLFANHYFTSYKEGWRTDRGMIYIMYGPPDKLYKEREGEQWGYKRSVIKSTWGNRYKVTEEYIWFNFRHKPGRFTTNDYYLSRTDAPTFWDQAVTNWRNGIVFRLDNPKDF